MGNEKTEEIAQKAAQMHKEIEKTRIKKNKKTGWGTLLKGVISIPAFARKNSKNEGQAILKS